MPAAHTEQTLTRVPPPPSPPPPSSGSRLQWEINLIYVFDAVALKNQYYKKLNYLIK